eukprot:10693545-Alexandrium_andersonii.AAC.1
MAGATLHGDVNTFPGDVLDPFEEFAFADGDAPGNIQELDSSDGLSLVAGAAAHGDVDTFLSDPLDPFQEFAFVPHNIREL